MEEIVKKLKEWADLHSPLGSVQAKQILKLIDDWHRLKRGDFTEEEFQNLCHNCDENDAARFKKGCEAYQRKLFGTSSIDDYAKYVIEQIREKCHG